MLHYQPFKQKYLKKQISNHVMSNRASAFVIEIPSD